MSNFQNEPFPLQFSTKSKPIGQTPDTHGVDELLFTSGVPSHSPLTPNTGLNVVAIFWTIIFVSLALGVYLSFRTF